MPSNPRTAILHFMNATNFLRLDQPAQYRLRLQGNVPAKWSDWLQNANLVFEGGQTIVIGDVRDQAALFGLLSLVRNLGAVLIAVELIQPL